MVARESLKGYLARTRKSLDEFDDSKMQQRDRERLTAKFAEAEEWLKEVGDGATKQEVAEMQAASTAAWNTIMIKVSQSLNDFWDEQMEASTGEKIVTVKDGGFFTTTGIDLRELIDEPD